MVKLRGYRVELAEVEEALQAHSNVREAAVIVSGVGPEARLIAVVSGVPEASRSLLDIKRHCAERLPSYMVVDDVCFVDTLPRTRTGKIDFRTLADEVSGRKALVG
jgi:acyl-coenzyme A synthetase/AMP-(fatty) acid ligase